MATNKQAIIRYRVIDRCLRNTDRSWNWKALADECVEEISKVLDTPISSISERTIKGDISDMRNDERLGYYAPIEYDRKEKSYYYSDLNYSITESPINKSEAKELKNMINLMRQFTGFKYMSGIENILSKLELIVNESTRTTRTIVMMEKPVFIAGQEHIDDCYKAIRDKQTLSITYQPFEGPISTAIISPYLLKEYQNRWYLIAYKHQNQAMRTYGLERIQNITPSISAFIDNGFDAEAHYKDVIGVTLDPNIDIEKIQFRVKGRGRFYIETNPIHHSQKCLHREEEVFTFEIEVRPNYELEKIFKSYGDALEVVKV